MSSESSTYSSTPFSEEGLKKLPWIAISVAVILVGTYLWIFRSLPFGENPGAFGGFGDYIGGLLNPLISLFTLVVAVSVWKPQKTELIETRKALEAQGQTANLQRREQRFFDFLNIYRSTVDSIEASASNMSSILKGKRAFAAFNSTDARNPFVNVTDLFSPLRQGDAFPEEAASNARMNWGLSSSLLDHYFRIVFTVLREAEPTLKEDCWRYMKLLRAQLSRDEINLLAMNLLFDEEGIKMRSLAARYGLLKHMPPNALRKIAEEQLESATFGRNWSAKAYQIGTI